MEIDRKTIKALAVDTRLDILSSLKKRRKMPSELARELSLSSPTVIEHMAKLEDAGLVKRVETGHKWVYYELTTKGDSMIRPKFPVEFVLMLSLGVIFVLSGVLNSTYTDYQLFTF